MYKINQRSAGKIICGAVCAAGIGIGITAMINRTSTYDRDGFDFDGFDREGYNHSGYNRSGYDRQGYDSTGFDADGFDRSGFDREGYTQSGYDSEGYDRTGRDHRGFDRNGYDSEGFDKFGRDSEGYNRRGYDIHGYNREGYDWRGFGRDHYNADGLDRCGHNRNFYAKQLLHFQHHLEIAHQNLQKGEYRYALYESRVVMDEALRCIIEHNFGKEGIGNAILDNLTICENKKLLNVDRSFYSKMHDVRKICNSNEHELAAGASMSHDTVHFVISQTRELLDSAKQSIIAE